MTNTNTNTNTQYNEAEEQIVATGKIRKSKVTGKKVTDYIYNKALTLAVIQYNERHKERMEKGLPQERIPDSIGLAIMKIAEGIGSRYNFRNYTYLEEMIGDAIEQGVYSVTKFNLDKIKLSYVENKKYFTFLDPKKYKRPTMTEEELEEFKANRILNPQNIIFSGRLVKEPNAYGYFTFIMWRKMTNRIKIEKEQQKIIEDLMGDPNYVCYEHDENGNDEGFDISKENAVDFYYDGKLE